MNMYIVTIFFTILLLQTEYSKIDTTIQKLIQICLTCVQILILFDSHFNCLFLLCFIV